MTNNIWTILSVLGTGFAVYLSLRSTLIEIKNDVAQGNKRLDDTWKVLITHSREIGRLQGK